MPQPATLERYPAWCALDANEGNVGQQPAWPAVIDHPAVGRHGDSNHEASRPTSRHDAQSGGDVEDESDGLSDLSDN